MEKLFVVVVVVKKLELYKVIERLNVKSTKYQIPNSNAWHVIENIFKFQCKTT